MHYTESRERFKQRIWDSVRASEYPSPPMLDRLEGVIATKEDGEAYLDLLWEKAPGEYPSLQIMARIERTTNALALVEKLDD